MPPPHANKHKRIKIDAPFAAIPQALVLDTQTSAAACRLWCVLYVFHWDGTPPDFDKLATALNTTERSVYRWLQELEARHWIDWDRNNKGMLDRFTLHMHSDVVENVTSVNPDQNKLIPGSKTLIPGSKTLTQRSGKLTQVSISECFDPTLTPRNESALSDQNHEKIQKGGGGGRARDSVSNGTPAGTDDPLIALFARYDITQAEPLARLYHEKWPDITLDALTRLCERLSEPDAGSYAGARLYRKLKAGPYERRSDSDRAGPRPRADQRPADPDGATPPERGPVRTTLDY